MIRRPRDRSFGWPSERDVPARSLARQYQTPSVPQPLQVFRRPALAMVTGVAHVDPGDIRIGIRYLDRMPLPRLPAVFLHLASAAEAVRSTSTDMMAGPPSPWNREGYPTWT